MESYIKTLVRNIRDQYESETLNEAQLLGLISNLKTSKELTGVIQPIEDIVETACKRGHLAVLQALESFVHLDFDHNCAIEVASKYGRDHVVEYLLTKHEVDPSDNDDIAIEMAARNGHVGVVAMLLKDKRVSPEWTDALVCACRYGHTDVVRLLLHYMNPAEDKNYAIGTASKHGHFATVKLLMDDERVNASDHDNYAISKALENGHIEIMALLIQDPRVSLSTTQTRDLLEFMMGNPFETEE